MKTSRYPRPDLTLILSADGLIQEATPGLSLADEKLGEWVGAHWESTVIDSGPAKVRRLLDTALNQRVCGFSQINQRLPSGRELLMEFSAVRSDAEQREIVAIGKNLGLVVEQQQKMLATQQSIEREYWKLRDIESRYRAMITSTSEAVVLVRERDLGIVEANSHARGLLDLPGKSDANAVLKFGVDTVRIENMLLEIRRSGQAPSTLVHLGPGRDAWRVKATMVRGAREQHFLLQFSRVESRSAASHLLATEGPSREGFVILDADGLVQMANEPFAKLAGTADAATLVGQHIDTWFKGFSVDGPGGAAGVQTLQAQSGASEPRRMPVKISVCDLRAVKEGGIALMIETLAPISGLH